MSGPITSSPAAQSAASPGRAARPSKGSSAGALGADESKPGKSSPRSKRAPDGSLLNPRHEEFAQAYATEPNATRAALAAGSSERVAHVAGHKLLRQVHIQERISELQKETGKAVEWQVTRESIVRCLADVVHGRATMNQVQVRAAEVLNRMLGFNEPEKTDGVLEIFIRE